MADPGKNAITTHAGDGSTAEFSIGFPYLQPEDVHVTVAGVAKTLNTDYQIDTGGTNVVFIGASVPVSGAVVVFTRRSKRSGTAGDSVGLPPILIVNYRNANSLTAQNAILADLQGFYYGEEIEDKI